MDVGGYDPKYKLVIATAHAYGVFVKPEDVLNIGIQNFSEYDKQYAKEKNYKIKLVPTARKINDREVILYVLPKLIGPDNFLYNVENEYNGVIVQAAFADQQFFFGKGAGGHPTGSAVLSDIAALRYDYHYEYKKYHQYHILHADNNLVLTIYLRYTDEELPNVLDFDSVTERFYSNGFKYIIGEIKLQNLIDNQETLRKDGVFIAEVPEIEKKKNVVETGKTPEILKSIEV